MMMVIVKMMIMVRMVINATKKGEFDKKKVNLISLAHKGSLDRSQPWSPIKEIC